jgi:hypothetical protein
MGWTRVVLMATLTYNLRYLLRLLSTCIFEKRGMPSRADMGQKDGTCYGKGLLHALRRDWQASSFTGKTEDHISIRLSDCKL